MRAFLPLIPGDGHEVADGRTGQGPGDYDVRTSGEVPHRDETRIRRIALSFSCSGGTRWQLWTQVRVNGKGKSRKSELFAVAGRLAASRRVLLGVDFP